MAVVCRRATDRQVVRRGLATSDVVDLVHVSADAAELLSGDTTAEVVVMDNYLDGAHELYNNLRAANPRCRIVVVSDGVGEVFSLSVPRHLVVIQEPRESMDEVVLRYVRGPAPKRPSPSPKVARRSQPEPAATPVRQSSAMESLRQVAAVGSPANQDGKRSHMVIGSSTGGPEALRAVLTRLPSNFPLPILVVQHMPAGFTADLAHRLDELTRLTVREATPGVRPRRGEIWIAPGDHHMVIGDVTGQLALGDGPKVHACRPSVDVLFESAARAFGSRVVGVVLTGMGTDGRDGCERISAAGGHVICQDEKTSTVWGMPGSVAKAGFANEVLPLEQIAVAMLGQTLGGARRRKQKMAAGGDQCQ